MRFYIILFLFLLLSNISIAQKGITLKGFLKDSLTKESLIGATISVKGLGKGISTNNYGFYSITLPTGKYEIVSSYVGYISSVVSIDLKTDIDLDIYLLPKSTLSEEIIITSKQRDANIKNAQMGKVDLSMNRIRSLPMVFGEVDPLKALQLMPGVRNAGEGNSGLYVRGGGPDQNLILLDDAVVYNPGHLFGFFSVFNGDAIKNISLIKGGMPAQYGGRLSSVLDISMKDGNMEKWQSEGGIGTIASRFALQGPVVKNKSSFILSGRRTYIDILSKPFIPKTSSFYGSGYFFYDMNVKWNYKFSSRDRLFVSGYFGRDVFDFINRKRSFNTNIPWGNTTATSRWNHVFNKKLFANTTIVFNDYRFAFSGSQDNFNITLRSGIRDLSIKSDLDHYLNTSHKLKYGFQYTLHRFTPSVVSGNQDSIQFQPNNAQLKYANEIASYVQDDWDISEKLKLNVGLRYSGFQQVGPYKDYSVDLNGNRLDSIQFGKGEQIKYYGGIEPRFTVRYSLNDATSLKSAISKNIQYIHLVSNAGTTLPTDVWVPSTLYVKPQISWQYSTGIFKNFKDNLIETSLEFYYKKMYNQIEYKEGYTPSITDPEKEFVFGNGWSYGSELFINKSRGKFTGWIGYTLSWTWRKFELLNGGKKYPAKYDRRHDFSLVCIYEKNAKWKFSGVFVYATGNATTLPESFIVIEGLLSQQFSGINQYRLPSYHRMDLSATFIPHPQSSKRLRGSWVFSIYNVYSRKNPFFIYFDQTGNLKDNNLKVEARQVSLFPIIPSVTWNFKF